MRVLNHQSRRAETSAWRKQLNMMSERDMNSCLCEPIIT